MDFKLNVKLNFNTRVFLVMNEASSRAPVAGRPAEGALRAAALLAPRRLLPARTILDFKLNVKLNFNTRVFLVMNEASSRAPVAGRPAEGALRAAALLALRRLLPARALFDFMLNVKLNFNMHVVFVMSEHDARGAVAGRPAEGPLRAAALLAPRRLLPARALLDFKLPS